MPQILVSPSLVGLQMLDLSCVLAGSTCIRMLVDFGVDVIRIEPLPVVDSNEAMFVVKRLGGDFQNLNRMKRAMSLRLMWPEGLSVLWCLVECIAAAVKNGRPDVKKRPGLSRIARGMGGLMSVAGHADSSTGLYAAVGILIALLRCGENIQARYCKKAALTQRRSPDFANLATPDGWLVNMLSFSHGKNG